MSRLYKVFNYNWWLNLIAKAQRETGSLEINLQSNMHTWYGIILGISSGPNRIMEFTCYHVSILSFFIKLNTKLLNCSRAYLFLLVYCSAGGFLGEQVNISTNRVRISAST